ncbi:MAG: hypothetical protein ABW133_25755 [Polyangiaceae bacterium]
MASVRDFAPSRVFASLVREGTFDLLAPGLYAWGVTVAWPASHRLAPFASRVLAGVALGALLVGSVASRFWPPLRIAALWVVVATSLGSWVLLARAIDPSHLDPVHGLLGSVGWAAFAVVWGGERTRVPAPEPPGRPLPWPRERRRTVLLMSFLATAAAVPIALAWWVQTTERAMLAHAVSLAAGIALIARAADMAAPVRREPQPLLAVDKPRRRLAGAAGPLAVLAGLALIGALFGVLR